jgi:hypothetical protein
VYVDGSDRRLGLRRRVGGGRGGGDDDEAVSSCICTSECGDKCLNRALLTECTATNCRLAEDICKNRVFERRMYR